MLPTLKSEFKKLLTVRSTYIIVFIVLALSTFFTYMGTSPITYEEPVGGKTIQKTHPGGVVEEIPDPEDPPVFIKKTEYNLPATKVVSNLYESMQVVALFTAVVVVLFMAHEFRYNTITYTLTASNRRSKVLLSKLIVATTFVLTVTALGAALVIASTFVAIGIKDLHLPAQDINWLYIGARTLGYTLGYSLMGLAIITLVRSLTAGVVAIFILPIIDSIIGALLSTRGIEATRALPFSALNRIGNTMQDFMSKDMPVESFATPQNLPASALGATGVFLVYLIAIWAITWVLFLKRDAN